MTEQITAPAPTIRKPLTSLDGLLLKHLFASGTAWLEYNAEVVNRLNVFPVPDGDTGTNMLLTMRSAMRETADVPSRRADEIAAQVAQGALMGARGNSGVILSQLLRGFARAIDGNAELSTGDIADGLQHASDMAYKAVMKPVEGTILTVARAAAEKAQQSAGETDSVDELLHDIVRAAKHALQRTPELLPVLAEAGVVDSGGQGLVALFEGMLHYLEGESLQGTPEQQAEEEWSVAEVPPEPFEDGRYGYDVQFLLRGQNLDVDEIRDYVRSAGECALVVGDPTLVKVHVHCLDPGPVLSYGVKRGMLDDIVVENMDLQYQEFKTAPTTEPAVAPVDETVTTDAIAGIGTVAVAPSDGFKRIFESLGVSATVTGGQTMNPSTEDILAAIQRVNVDTVIVLPNNKNIVMAAEQTRDMTSKEVHIVPTRSLPQGVAALMALNYTADARTNVRAMQDAMEQVVTVEITEAVRSTHIGGVDVREGERIGLLDGQLVAAGPDEESVIRQVFEQVDLLEYEIVTIYYGADVTRTTAEALRDTLTEAYDVLEFDVLAGGQPHYRYIISIE